MSNKQKFLDTTTHNIAWFYKRSEDNEIELSPPFQRNPVWSDSQKSFLIDSILSGFPIPEVYIQEFTSEDGDEEYVVVDGQQRLRACIDFVNNEFSLVSSGKQAVKNEGSFFRDLSPDERKTIFNYSFIVRKLPEMSREELRDIFSRLNRNVVALNAQELRHSVYWGEFITVMEDLSDSELWTKIGVFTPNDVRRMLDVEYVSELAVAVLHGIQNKKSGLDDWYATYEKDFPGKKRIKTVFSTILAEMISLVPDISETRFSKKSDFYSLFIFLNGHIEKFPLTLKDRKNVGRSLKAFASLVDDYIADPDLKPIPPIAVRNYGNAVSRAASDLGSRKVRQNSLGRAIQL